MSNNYTNFFHYSSNGELTLFQRRMVRPLDKYATFQQKKNLMKKILIDTSFQSIKITGYLGKPIEVDGQHMKILSSLFRDMSSYGTRYQSIELTLSAVLVNDNLLSLVSLLIKRRLLSNLYLHDRHGSDYEVDLTSAILCLGSQPSNSKHNHSSIVSIATGTRSGIPALRLETGFGTTADGQHHPIEKEQEFQSALAKSKSIKRIDLYLRNNNNHRQIEPYLRGISSNKSLRTLHLSMRWFSHEQFTQFLNSVQQHPCIEELSFEGYYNRFDFRWVYDMYKFLSSAQCKLSSLTLTGCDIDVDDFDLLLSALHATHPLRRFNVSYNSIDSFALPRFFGLQNPSTNLVLLDIRANVFPGSARAYIRQVTKEEYVSFAEMLCQLLEKVPRLYLDFGYDYGRIIEGSPMRDKIEFLLDRNLENSHIVGDVDSDTGATLPIYETMLPSVLSHLFQKQIMVYPSIVRQANQIYRKLYHDGGFILLLGKTIEERKVHIRSRKRRAIRLGEQQQQHQQQHRVATSTTAHGVDDNDDNELIIIPHHRSSRQFEIVCYGSKYDEYRNNNGGGSKDNINNNNNNNVKITSILETQRIFMNVQKNIYAPASILQKSFGTKNELEIAKQILIAHKQQYQRRNRNNETIAKNSKNNHHHQHHHATAKTTATATTRSHHYTDEGGRLDDKILQIAAWISKNCHNVHDNTKFYTTQQIYDVLKFRCPTLHIHLTKPISLQYQDCLLALQPILPMKRIKTEYSIRISKTEQYHCPMMEAYLDDHDIEWEKKKLKKQQQQHVAQEEEEEGDDDDDDDNVDDDEEVENDEIENDAIDNAKSKADQGKESDYDDHEYDDNDDGYDDDEYDDEEEEDDDDDEESENDASLYHQYKLELDQREYSIVEKYIRKNVGIDIFIVG